MRTLLTGCGTIATGDRVAPLATGNSVRIEDGRISAVGAVPDEGADLVYDLGGATLIPGLIDAHSHPVLGDYTPRQQALGWTGRMPHGGVTTLISAGETHWPGRQKDGAEAAAICRAAYLSSRGRAADAPRVFGGALLLDAGITEADIDALHASGVRLLGEIGLGSEKRVERIAELVAHAKNLGWVAPLHYGGASVPGSSVVGLDMATAVQPTVISHANGGPTARPLEEVLELIDHTDCAIEIVFAGNMRAAAAIVAHLAGRAELHRLQLGTDTPSGTGVVPLGMLRLLTELAAATGIAPEELLCAATGDTAARYGLSAAEPGQRGESGHASSDLGRIVPGAVADLVVLDAPLGAELPDAFSAMRAGNVPAVAGVFIDGVLAVGKSVATPPPLRALGLAG